ncbi:hypothetical protein K438DRAFT_1452336, partial [Mycena galopus ATCC 62051]
PRKKAKVDVVLPDVTELDKLFIRTLDAGKDEDKKLYALYGPVLATTTPMRVTIHGSGLNVGKISASAGSSAYWGPNSRRNTNARVWGGQTNARAELLGALLAIKNAPPAKSLEISTRSEYVIHSIAHYAPTNDACGWRCPNGDILKRILVLIKSRTAPLHF